VPAAACQAAELLAVADFASIGSNDLLQYFFAIDRDNAAVSDENSAEEEAFWALLGQIAAAAAAQRKPLAVCGELATEANAVERLLDMGINRLTVAPRRIPFVRRLHAFAPEADS
jgi:phosphoenolpyruvate-protein kinase (PTS system EI component)